MLYCTETDLLLYEPALLTASQSLVDSNTQPHVVAFSGSGSLSGDLLTCGAGTFTDRQVGRGSVLVVSAGGGTVTVAVADTVDDTTVVVSRLLPGLWGRTQPRNVIVPGTYDATWQQVVFPAVGVVSASLEEAFGVAGVEVILNPPVLRRPCVLGALAQVFRSLGAFERNVYGSGGTNPGTTVSAEYRRLADAYAAAYQKALRGVRLEIDSNGYGRADEVRRLDAPAIERA